MLPSAIDVEWSFCAFHVLVVRCFTRITWVFLPSMVSCRQGPAHSTEAPLPRVRNDRNRTYSGFAPRVIDFHLFLSWLSVLLVGRYAIVGEIHCRINQMPLLPKRRMFLLQKNYVLARDETEKPRWIDALAWCTQTAAVEGICSIYRCVGLRNAVGARQWFCCISQPVRCCGQGKLCSSLRRILIASQSAYSRIEGFSAWGGVWSVNMIRSDDRKRRFLYLLLSFST